MTQTNYNSVMSPEACITVNRNRIRTYGDKIYLKNKTHFEIELFNPITKRVKATIEIDGSPISTGGIVLRPGERVYLERWLDDAKKFLFETYEIENSGVAKGATKENGRIVVKFYKEEEKKQNGFPWGNITYTTTSNWDNTKYRSLNDSFDGAGGMMSVNSMNVNSSFFSSEADFTSFDLDPAKATPIGKRLKSTKSTKLVGKLAKQETLETGRAEKGESSDQVFNTTTGTFESWTTSVSTWQILPESQQPIDSSMIRSYCTNCGTRMRTSSWKFCPSCGNKRD